MEYVEHIFQSQSGVQIGEGAGVFFEDNDLFSTEFAEVLHFLLELVDLEIIIVLLTLQELCELLLLLLRVGVFEEDPSNAVVMGGVCTPLVDGELLREEVAGSGRLHLAVQ